MSLQNKKNSTYPLTLQLTEQFKLNLVDEIESQEMHLNPSFSTQRCNKLSFGVIQK